MRIVVGTLFVLLGGISIAYVAAGGAVFPREPPLVALGVLLVAVGAGFWARSRAAALLARVALGTALAGIVWIAVGYVSFGSLHDTDELVRRVYLFAMAMPAAAVAVLFLFVRRVPRVPAFGAIDAVPLAGVAAALVLGVLWLAGEDPRLRPCRLGNASACQTLAVQLVEAGERAPGAPPARWEEDAARVLEAQGCGPEPGPCALQRYALGNVALRAGRVEAARREFAVACAEDRTWCARTRPSAARPSRYWPRRPC
ncbi:MAG TPA: hypothetical protein VGT02_13090 [Methylomirabilota bacterium]|nr:hypothetical protein [Methylomirabilota bacterium]